jgi:uncharacterized membrane protein YdcZ (DUF606 family)
MDVVYAQKNWNIHRWERENDTKCWLILAATKNFTVGIDTLMDVVCAQKNWKTFIDGSENDTKCWLILAVATNFTVGIDTLLDVVYAQKKQQQKNSSMGRKKWHYVIAHFSHENKFYCRNQHADECGMYSKKLRNIFRWEGENDTKLSLILAVAINFTVGIDTLMDVVCAQKNLGTFIDGNVKKALSVRSF